MAAIKNFRLFFLLAPLLLLGNGCATLPNVSTIIDDAPAAQQPPQIVSKRGLLPPERRAAIVERLKSSVNPTDMLERHSAVMEQVSDSPLIKGNRVDLLTDGEAAFAAMFEAMRNAQDHINIETFTFEDDEVGRKFADLLLKKQAEGIQVNIIYDSVGSFRTSAAFFKRLRDGGIRVVEFNPANPLKARGQWSLGHQDHRKITIVDGKIVIMGGINISAVYSRSFSGRTDDGDVAPPWRDTDVRIEGPAVAAFQKLFLDTWQRQQGPKLPDRNYFPEPEKAGRALVRVIGSTSGQENRITFISYVAAIIFAEHTVHLTNAYFIPDDQILTALADAAKRGVDVRIVLPSVSDSSVALDAARYNYADLLRAGVRIYELRDALLHAKTAVIDGVWATVGSTNLDFWSLLRNDEVNAIILSPDFAVEMETMFTADVAASTPILLEEWEKRPLFQRIREWTMHLLYRGL